MVFGIIREMVFLQISVPDSGRRKVVIRTQAYFQKRTGSHKYITQTHLSHQSYGIVTRIQSTYNRFSEHAKRQKDTCFSVRNNKVTLRSSTTPGKLMDDFYTLDNQKHNVAQDVMNVL